MAELALVVVIVAALALASCAEVNQRDKLHAFIVGRPTARTYMGDLVYFLDLEYTDNKGVKCSTRLRVVSQFQRRAFLTFPPCDTAAHGEASAEASERYQSASEADRGAGNG